MAMEEKHSNNEVVKLTESWRIVKNVVIISFAFMVQFTAYSVSKTVLFHETTR